MRRLLLTGFTLLGILGHSTHAATLVGATAGSFGVSDSGAATYTIPIAVPPGTAGMEPKLALSYASQGGNGIAGVGWSLAGLSAITRCPQTIVQDGAAAGITLDANDRFCLDGQRLILMSGASYGAVGSEYRTEIESFSKVVAYGGTAGDPQYFRVWTKAGQIIEFGNTIDSRVEAQGKTAALSWAANKISDTVGNYFTFTYFEDNTNGEHHVTRIDYTGNSAAALSTYNAVDFVYEARPDPAMSYVAGSLLRQTQRLTHVRTSASGVAVMDYALGYETGVTTGRSRLVNLTQCAANGDCLAPTVFGWQEGQAASFGADVVSSAITGTTANTWFAMGDVNGDGRTDLVTFNTSRDMRQYTADATGALTQSQQFISAFAGVAADAFNPGEWRFFMADLNGDGYAEPVACGIVGYIDLNLDKGWAVVPWTTQPHANGSASIVMQATTSIYLAYQPYAVLTWKQWCMPTASPNGRNGINWYAPEFNKGFGLLSNVNADASYGNATFTAEGDSVPLSNADTSVAQTGDLDGDGAGDMLRYDPATGALHIWLQRAGAFAPVINLTIDASGTPQQSWFQLADVNGDGLVDIVLHDPTTGSIKVWLSKGDGTIGSKVETLGFSTGGTPADTWFEMVDINADGRADAVKYNPTTGVVTVALAKGDGSFGAPQLLASFGAGAKPTLGLGPAPTSSWFQSADVNGDGLPDFVRYDPAIGQIKVNLGQGAMPDLLLTVTNGFNATTTLGYKPLTDPSVYTKGTGAIYPDKDVAAPLYVVANVTTDNGAGGNFSATHTYAGARFNQNGRGLLGFASHRVHNDQTGIYTDTVYRQDHPYIGVPLSVRTYSSAGVLVSAVDNTYANQALGGTRYFPYLAQSVEASYDLNSASLISRVTTVNSLFDTYGNAGQITVTSNDGYVKTTVNTYTNDSANWILGRLTRAEVTSTLPDASNAKRVSAFEYSPSTGLLTKEIIEPDLPQFRLETTYTLDTFGNRKIITVSSPATGDAAFASRSTTVGYDAQGRFATSTTNALGHQETRIYDSGLGVLKTLTGPNNLTTQWQYDGFGRKRMETRADTTHTDISYESCDVNAPGSCAYAVRTRELGAPESVAYFDKLGRATRGAVVGFDGAWIFKDTQYDYAGRVGQVSRPYFAGSAAYWAVSTYDDLGRIKTLTEPNTALTQSYYSGLFTTTTDANNHPTTRVKNSQGQLVSVTDARAGVTSYTYDPFGNLTKTVALGVTTQMGYDIRGRKISMDDPDMGHWDYTVNSLGELVKQTDAKRQVVTMLYDTLGRMTQRSEPDLISTWNWDTSDGVNPCGLSKGKLCNVGTDNGILRTIYYDSYARPQLVYHDYGAGSPFVIETNGYDAYGRIRGNYIGASNESAQIIRTYNAYGYLSQLTRASDNKILWTPKNRNAEGQPLLTQLGNGVNEYHSFNPRTGRMGLNIANSTTADILSTSYIYDNIGNLKTRNDLNAGSQETFNYDELDRLIDYTNGTAATQYYTYDATGNLKTKSANILQYGAACSGSGAGPHAVCSTAATGAYAYDANGNLKSGAGRSFTYTSYNQVSQISEAAGTTTFIHDADHSRVKQTRPDGSVEWYINPVMGVGLPLEHSVSATATEIKIALITPDGQIGQSVIHIENGVSSTLTRYFHKDYQGSILAVTDDVAPAPVAQYTYDGPWGARIIDVGSKLTRRGYTGHEHLDDGLIHMNGRVYDPAIGRFLQADPYIQSPSDGQSYNRYSYVLNNPMFYTDPSGFSAWTDFRDGFVKPVVAIAVAVYLGPSGAGALTNSAFANTLIAGAASGAITGGRQGAIQGAFSAGLFYGAGSMAGGLGFSESSAGRALLHAGAGCLSASAAGGSCGSGALSAGLAQYAGSNIHVDGMVGNVVARSIIGGTASVLGGGKFANGAMTGAFGYLFNCGAHPGSCMRSKDDPQTKTSLYHEYELDRPVCDLASGACTMANAMQQGARFTTPSADGSRSISTGDKSIAEVSTLVGDVPIGRVEHVVDYANNAIFNITLHDHLLSPGYVYLNFYQTDTQIRLRIYGEGNGWFPGTNERRARETWQPVYDNIQRALH